MLWNKYVLSLSASSNLIWFANTETEEQNKMSFVINLYISTYTFSEAMRCTILNDIGVHPIGYSLSYPTNDRNCPDAKRTTKLCCIIFNLERSRRKISQWNFDTRKRASQKHFHTGTSCLFTCCANSRVGAKIKAYGPLSASISRSILGSPMIHTNKGIKNAAVFPLPLHNKNTQ